MAPEGIVLTRPEAIGVLGALDDASALLLTTDYLVVLLELEEAGYLVLDRLFPEDGRP